MNSTIQISQISRDLDLVDSTTRQDHQTRITCPLVRDIVNCSTFLEEVIWSGYSLSSCHLPEENILVVINCAERLCPQPLDAARVDAAVFGDKALPFLFTSAHRPVLRIGTNARLLGQGLPEPKTPTFSVVFILDSRRRILRSVVELVYLH